MNKLKDGLRDFFWFILVGAVVLMIIWLVAFVVNLGVRFALRIIG